MKNDNTSTNDSQWTPQHDDACLTLGLPPAARKMWHWLVTTGSTQEREPDLKEFNEHIEKLRGSGYHRDTLKNSYKQLVEAGVIREVKRFSWNIKRVLIRSVNSILHPVQPPGKKSDSCKENRTSRPAKVENVSHQGITTTTSLSEVEEKIELAKEAGLNYDTNDGAWMANYSMSEIAHAIAYFLGVGAENLSRPLGWFRNCVRQGWAKKAEQYYCAPNSADAKYHQFLKRLADICAESKFSPA